MTKIQMFIRFLLINIIVFSAVNTANAQKDTVIVSDDLILVGTVKSMNRGVITMDTDFSTKNISIDLDEIKELYTESKFLITDRNGNRYYGSMESVDSDSIRLITDQDGKILMTKSDLVNLERIDEGFKHRFFYSIDVGFSMAQANNLKQLTSKVKIGYKANNWLIEGRFNGLMSTQDETEKISRWDRNVAFNYLLGNNWFVNPEVQFFSSTEQKLDMRIVPSLGIGKILIRSNQVEWSCIGGINMNFENFSAGTEDRKSIEGLLGTEINLYEIRDLSFLGYFYSYPSLTEKNRWRFDLMLDLKYSFPLGFYVTTGYTVNFDNMPVEGASGSDYLFNVGVGWQW
jgi:hypothetical protein